MENNLNEKVVDLSGTDAQEEVVEETLRETSLEADDVLIDDEPMPTRRSKNAANNKKQKQSKNSDGTKGKPKKKASLVSNIILVIGVLGILIGGYILGTTLYKEYTRSQMTKAYLEEALSVVNPEKYISREAFNPQPGERVGVLEIPSQDMITPIVEGMDWDDLFASAGHVPETHWPGDNKQVFLSGHRNTEFGVLKNVKEGDVVIVKMQYGEFKYRITGTKIVNQHDTHVIDGVTDFENDQLVLMTCYPFTFGADTEERYLVYGERIIE